MYWPFICLLSLLSVTNAAVMNNTNVAESEVSKPESVENIKMDTFKHILQQLDHAVQNLEEKAHNWDIFRHHIDAWNDQFKSLEHKLELVKRAQDEQQAFGNKLISLEFTLNHILSKVLYLSDNCNMLHMQTDTIIGVNSQDSPRSHISASSNMPQQDTNALLNEQIELLDNLRTTLNANKKQYNEFGTRLGNILRHVQNIERDNVRRASSNTMTTATAAIGGNKMAKIMAPIGDNCNNTKRPNANIERLVKTLEHQLNALAIRTPTATEHKQLQALTKKNAQQLEHILRVVTSADEHLLQWRDDGVRGWRHCAALDGELTTFTESSDLLLKRIELVVREVNEKLTCQRKDTNETFDDNATDNEMDVDEQETDERGMGALDEDNTEIEGVKIKNNESETSNDVLNKNGTTTTTETEAETETEIEKGADSKVDVYKEYDLVESLQPLRFACHQLDLSLRIDMVYKFGTPTLNEAGRDFNERFCAFATNGPAWTVIQNRGPYAQQENFNRSWNEYRNGFGELNKDFWYGNEFIYQIVDHDDYELRVELTDFDDVQVWAEYGIFRLDSERNNYNLLIDGYRGTAPNAMNYHKEMDFSTYDRRNDRSVDACCACATGYASGWWFDNCSEANLNGVYRLTPRDHNNIGIIWEPWHGDYSLKKARMMIRPKHWTTFDGEGEVYNEFTEDP